jgi:hypothetical protein
MWATFYPMIIYMAPFDSMKHTKYVEWYADQDYNVSGMDEAK